MQDETEAALAAAWWRREVEPRIVAAREEMRARRRRREDEAPREHWRWRRVAETPTLVRAIPGFGDLWVEQVPERALERIKDAVSVGCPCGARVELPMALVTFCSGDCGRWFLRTARDVHVKRWPREEAAAA